MLRGRSYMSYVPRERGVTERVNVGRAKESIIPLPRAITIGQRNKLKERFLPSSRNNWRKEKMKRVGLVKETLPKKITTEQGSRLKGKLLLL